MYPYMQDILNKTILETLVDVENENRSGIDAPKESNGINDNISALRQQEADEILLNHHTKACEYVAQNDFPSINANKNYNTTNDIKIAFNNDATESTTTVVEINNHKPTGQQIINIKNDRLDSENTWHAEKTKLNERYSKIVQNHILATLFFATLFHHEATEINYWIVNYLCFFSISVILRFICPKSCHKTSKFLFLFASILNIGFAIYLSIFCVNCLEYGGIFKSVVVLIPVGCFIFAIYLHNLINWVSKSICFCTNNHCKSFFKNAFALLMIAVFVSARFIYEHIETFRYQVLCILILLLITFININSIIFNLYKYVKCKAECMILVITAVVSIMLTFMMIARSYDDMFCGALNPTINSD